MLEADRALNNHILAQWQENLRQQEWERWSEKERNWQVKRRSLECVCVLGFWLSQFLTDGARRRVRGYLRYYCSQAWQLDKAASIWSRTGRTRPLLSLAHEWTATTRIETCSGMYVCKTPLETSNSGAGRPGWMPKTSYHPISKRNKPVRLVFSIWHKEQERKRKNKRGRERENENVWSSYSLYCPVPSQCRKWRNRITSKICKPYHPKHTFPKATDKPT